MREQLARGSNIPVGTTLVKTGVAYPNASERVREALASYTRQVPNIRRRPMRSRVALPARGHERDHHAR
jgi:hypothetical protein